MLRQGVSISGAVREIELFFDSFNVKRRGRDKLGKMAGAILYASWYFRIGSPTSFHAQAAQVCLPPDSRRQRAGAHTYVYFEEEPDKMVACRW
jgi:hypothetical protein